MRSLWNELRLVWQARTLVWVLTRREVAARHAGTAAGVLWPYVQPLLTVGAYYLVFDVVFSMRLAAGNGGTHAVGTFLIVGALPWMAFCDAVSRGMGSLLDAGGLLQKNPLPPVLFVVRAVLGSMVIFGPLLILMALAYMTLHGVHASLVAMLPLVVLQWLLCMLLGYLLAIFAAALRDTVQIVAFLLSVGIYLTPVLFPINMFPLQWRWVLWFNPMTALVQGYQQVLLDGVWPASSVWVVTLAWIGLLAFLLDKAVLRSRDQLVDWL